MTAFEYIQARDAALSIGDPVERRRAYLRAKNKRCHFLIFRDPERRRHRQEKINAARRLRRGK